jgi:hypothetical protein
MERYKIIDEGIIIEGTGEKICTIPHGMDEGHPQYLRVSLLAAAPELLAACECLVDRVLKGEIEVRWTCKDKICPNELANLGGMLDVIKKAKGEL